ncbi:MAG: hypothetical protein J07HQW2_03499 [Haloquadratum walsbyi J07HQW2]|uniref:Uncharacterized protein n=1 Tax=Haloquadratum walsbyi J07HQW2 TaxID=1238425 RepID=U1NJA7_9EURY|nr:MAG: hypothetical protein J07HQW2_03499 [Haloquadratum walsbyi J07HQW2]
MNKLDAFEMNTQIYYLAIMQAICRYYRYPSIELLVTLVSE